MSRRNQQLDSICSHMQDVRADYDAAKSRSNRFLRNVRLPSTGVSADYHIASSAQLMAMVELARHFERNSPIVAQGVKRLVANVGVGNMQLDPQTGNPQVNARLKQRWADWSGNKDACDTRGQLAWAELCDLVFYRLPFDGDVFGLPQENGRLQTFEAHRCREPNRSRKDAGTCGVRRDADGRPVEYLFTKEPIEPLAQLKTADVEPIPAYNKKGFRQVFHVFEPTRLSQSRGIGWMVPVSTTEGMRDDICFAKLVQSQLQSVIGILKERDLGASVYGSDGTELGPVTESTWTDGSGRSSVELHPGVIVGGEPGVHYSAFSANAPNATYFDHERLLLTYLSVNLQLPLIVLLLDASDTTFSSYRHVLDQARMVYGKMQRWFASMFHAEVYRWKCRQWLKSDPELASFFRQTQEIPGDEDLLFKHGWNAMGWDYIEPVKDATAHLIELANGLTSPRRFSAERWGTSWEQLSAEIVDDRAAGIRLAIAAAEKIAAETGADVTWRDLLPTPTAQGITLTLSDAPPADSAPAARP